MLEQDTFDKSLNLYSLAKAIAEQAFTGKYGFLGSPYSDRLFRVAEMCIDESNKVVAILHDQLEDYPTWSAERLLKYFPQDIVDDAILFTKHTNQRYEEYIHCLHNGSKRALVVKISDLEDKMDLKKLPEIKEKDVLKANSIP